MMDKVAEVITALVISAVVSVGISMKEQEVQKVLLKENMAVTKELALAVTDLRIQLATFGERYITREELEKKLVKGGPNGP
jgi:hypothetical protein